MCEPLNNHEGRVSIERRLITNSRFADDIVVNAEKESKKISNDQELIQSDPTSCPQNQKGND